ncbi:MAG: PadR family transcriptional regulator [Chloroflexi bacterium]|nr:PadR family transcriptional regulator [Chloroflexota bacterium]
MSLKFGILGILASTGPRSGYDIKTYFEQGPNHVWQADLPQIYRTLDQLEQAEYVVVEADPSNARNRKVYTITSAGRAALLEWLQEDFEWSAVRDTNLLRVFFGALAPPGVLKQQVSSQRKQFIEILEQYRQVEIHVAQASERHPDEAFFWSLTVQSGLRLMQAWIDWSDDVLKQLEDREKGQS